MGEACGDETLLRDEMTHLLDAVGDEDLRLDTPAVNYAAPLLARTAL